MAPRPGILYGVPNRPRDVVCLFGGLGFPIAGFLYALSYHEVGGAAPDLTAVATIFLACLVGALFGVIGCFLRCACSFWIFPFSVAVFGVYTTWGVYWHFEPSAPPPPVPQVWGPHHVREFVALHDGGVAICGPLGNMLILDSTGAVKTSAGPLPTYSQASWCEPGTPLEPLRDGGLITSAEKGFRWIDHFGAERLVDLPPDYGVPISYVLMANGTLRLLTVSDPAAYVLNYTPSQGFKIISRLTKSIERPDGGAVFSDGSSLIRWEAHSLSWFGADGSELREKHAMQYVGCSAQIARAYDGRFAFFIARFNPCLFHILRSDVAGRPDLELLRDSTGEGRLDRLFADAGRGGFFESDGDVVRRYDPEGHRLRDIVLEDKVDRIGWDGEVLLVLAGGRVRRYRQYGIEDTTFKWPKLQSRWVAGGVIETKQLH